MERYKHKRKNKRTVKITPASQIANILQVMAVSGEIGELSFRLFGLIGKKVTAPKARATKLQMLSDTEYVDENRVQLFSGVAFSRRGTGQEKTIRISQNALGLFSAVPGGEYFIGSYEKNNMPSDRTHTLRSVSLADWCIFCFRANISFNPMFNPTLYNLGDYYEGGNSFNDAPTGDTEGAKREVVEAMFYSTKEINKRDGAGRLCCKGSRVIGNLVKPEGVFVCYSIPKTKMVWRAACERTMLEYTKSCFGVHNFDVPYNITEKLTALCIAESYEEAEQVVFAPPFSMKKKNKTKEKTESREFLPENDYSDRYTTFQTLFNKVCVFPKNEEGIKQFQYFSIPDVYARTIKLFINNPQDEKAAKSCGYDCDAYNIRDKIATLFFFDGCVTRLNRCASRMNSVGNGKNIVTVRIVCFPWQSEYVQKVMGDNSNYLICTEKYEDVYKWVSEVKL